MTSVVPSPADVLEVVDSLGPPGTPVTTPEVAERFDCTQRTIYNRLDALADDGELLTKKVGANSRVWWRSARERGEDDGDTKASERSFEDEDRYRTLFESLGEGFALCELVRDEDGRVVDFRMLELNPTFEDLMGIPVEEAEGRTSREVAPDGDPSLNSYTRMMEDREPIRFEREVEGLDLWLDVRAVPQEGDTFAVVYSDVTERKRAEQALRETDDLLRIALDVSEMGVWELDLRTNESMYHSSRHDEIFGYDVPIEGWSFERFLEHVHPDDREEVEDRYEETAETGDWEFECRITRPDGEQRWISARGEVEFEGDHPVRVVGTVQDITEHKRLVLDFEREKEQLEIAVEVSPLVFFRLDTDLRYTWIMNPAPDFDDEGVLGHRDDELLPPEEAEKILAPKRTALETGERVREEVAYEIPSGEVIYDLTVVPLHDESGEIVGVTCAALDVTERKHQEEEIRRQAELNAFRVELNDTIRELTDPVEVQEEASRVLGEYLGVNRTFYAEVEEDEDHFVIHRDYTDGAESVVGRYRNRDFGDYVVEETRAGRTLVVVDVPNDLRVNEEEARSYEAMGFRAFIGVPLVRDGQLRAMLGIHQAETREWTVEERTLAEQTAERTWDAVERARAEQELRRTNDRLERLNVASRELITATPEELRDRTAALTQHVLGVEFAALWRYDGTTGEIREHSRHADTGTDVEAIRYPGAFADRVWQAFVGDDVEISNDPPYLESPSPATSLRSSMLVPLGRHGVVCAGALQRDAFGEQTVDLVETLEATLESAWNRAEGQEQLTQQNEELHRLDSLNSLIRTIDQALVAADTREEIDEAVCNRLADSKLYEFAWLAEYDRGTDAMRPKAWAGVDSTYLEGRSVTVDEASVDDPLVAAIRTRERQVIDDIATDARAAPWREEALERGGRSCVKIPLVYEESLYGVLSVYGGRPRPDVRETDVLTELGESIAHAINAVETKATLRTDSVVELTLRAGEADSPLSTLSRETGSAIEVTGFVPGENGELIVFFSVTGTSPDDLRAAVERSLAIEDVTCLVEHDGEALFRARLTDSAFLSLFTTPEVAVRSVTIDASSVTAVVDLSRAELVREFVTQLRRWMSDVELLSRRTRARPLGSRYRPGPALEDRFTPRQLEVLQTAYQSGFFESPRVQTGQELSEALGISQSTFTYHLREAERRLCELAFEES